MNNDTGSNAANCSNRDTKPFLWIPLDTSLQLAEKSINTKNIELRIKISR